MLVAPRNALWLNWAIRMDGPTIIVVEDEQLILEAINDALMEGGYQVVGFTSGKDAIAHLAHCGGDVAGLITDIRLAVDDVSGWEVARHARELFDAIAVVFISGDSGGDWRAQGVPDSVFIQKPFASAQIVTAISSAICSSGNI